MSSFWGSMFVLLGQVSTFLKTCICRLPWPSCSKKHPSLPVQKSVPRRSHGKSRFGEMASHLPVCREKQYPTVIQSRRLRGGSGESARKSLKIVHMSDTHGKFYDVPNGDVLIHSGDFTNHGIRDGLEELEAFVLLAALNGWSFFQISPPPP